ncbi:hypothetical protein PRUB_b0318 [Pseudoalteromonas rubra]|uniref:Uncharacterized protein n=1 Tax=Pseudoalteromonas rubra TaxID=43658 RepID=A0A8T0C1H7_9GAMM|nr:hypothetical protein PRUB_b0318 [Pseudoalteromonas rubra]
MTAHAIGVNTNMLRNAHTKQQYAHYASFILIGIQQPRYLSTHLRPEALRPFLSKGLLF